MNEAFIDAEGLVVPTSALEIQRSRELAGVVETGRLAYVRMVECRRTANEGDQISETVVFEVEVERPQHCVHDIRRVERISARFESADSWYPEVVSLRSDFPLVPHLNLRDDELPRSICLYDESWSEIALRWTATGFVERVRNWLAETAKGTLHQSDQPLEPVLTGSGHSIILPSDLFSDWGDGAIKQLQIGRATSEDNCRVLMTNPDPRVGGVSVVAVCLMANPRQHSAIRRRPRTLAELHDLLAIDGSNLREQLHPHLEAVSDEERWNRKLLIVIAFPLSREVGCEVEVTDIWAFLSGSSVAEVGIAIGLWLKVPGGKELGSVMGSTPDATGDDIEIDVVSPQFGLSRESAAAASGLEISECRVLAIGAGALGSQVIRLMAQSGFGSWTILDKDLLAPHNMARHVLPSGWIGWSKATALKYELSGLYPTDEEPAGIVDDFVYGSTNNEQLKSAIDSADLIIDMSASVSAARHLAQDVECDARRMSLFLNPSGSDLVLLVEDSARTFTLDCLELQYYREIAFSEQLADHLAPPAGRIRYARSCRDVTSKIPTHLVTLHAAIGADGIRHAQSSEDASVTVWRSSGSPLHVEPCNVSVSPIMQSRIGEWTLTVTEHAISELSRLRVSKLPNETGGVLIGSYDLSRKVVYVVDTIPSPPDSKEWPTLYIRGSKGLASEVQRINAVTNGQLEYVGEWHSHPDGCSCSPSEDDVKVFAWLTENMSDAGLPALMAIAGERRLAWYLGEMHDDSSWETADGRE